MIIGNLAAVPISTIEGLPSKFEDYSGPRDQQLEKMTQALQKKLNFTDNFNADLKTLAVRHLIPLDVSFEINGKIAFIFLGLTEIEDYVRAKARLLSSNLVRLTFEFSSAPTTIQFVPVLALGT